MRLVDGIKKDFHSKAFVLESPGWEKKAPERWIWLCPNKSNRHPLIMVERSLLSDPLSEFLRFAEINNINMILTIRILDGTVCRSLSEGKKLVEPSSD